MCTDSLCRGSSLVPGPHPTKNKWPGIHCSCMCEQEFTNRVSKCTFIHRSGFQWQTGSLSSHLPHENHHYSRPYKLTVFCKFSCMHKHDMTFGGKKVRVLTIKRLPFLCLLCREIPALAEKTHAGSLNHKFGILLADYWTLF